MIRVGSLVRADGRLGTVTYIRPGAGTVPLAVTVGFNAARGMWYSPDLSHGNVAMLVEDGSDWPISGDQIATRTGSSLIQIVDWESMEESE